MTEFYDIVDRIKEELRSSPSINTVTFGDLGDVDLDKNTIFPLAHIYVENVETRQGSLLFNINVLVADVVDYNKEESQDDEFYLNDNLHDVFNTQLGTLNDLVSNLRRGTLYQDKFQLDGEPIFEPFKERFKNLLAGWETTVSILVKNELKVGLCSREVGDSITESSAPTIKPESSAPTIKSQSSYFIPLNEFIEITIEATNNPTTFTVSNLPNGLSFDSSTGIISGTATGIEESIICVITASNSVGTATRNITLNLTNESLDDLLAPYNLRYGNNSETNDLVTSFILSWDIRDYNGTISLAEIYQQGVKIGEKLYDGASNSFDISDSFRVDTVDGNFEYTVRLKNILGEFSPFSEAITVSTVNPFTYVNNESKTKTNPTLTNAVAYYKPTNDVSGDLIDELNVANVTLVNNSGLVLQNSLDYFASFRSFDGSQGFGFSDDVDNNFSFTNGTQDQPFSISLWFRKDTTNPANTTTELTSDILISKENEWELRVFNDIRNLVDTDKLEVQMSFFDNENAGEPFDSRQSSIPPNQQWESIVEKNVWNHVVITTNGLQDTGEDGSLLIFVNNVYSGGTGNFIPPSPAADNYSSMKPANGRLLIGGSDSDSGRISAIHMEEIVVFDRVLSKDEVNYLYNDGQPIELS